MTKPEQGGAQERATEIRSFLEIDDSAIDEIIADKASFSADFPVDGKFRILGVEYSGLRAALKAALQEFQNGYRPGEQHVMVEPVDSKFGAFSAYNLFSGYLEGERK